MRDTRQFERRPLTYFMFLLILKKCVTNCEANGVGRIREFLVVHRGAYVCTKTRMPEDGDIVLVFPLDRFVRYVGTLLLLFLSLPKLKIIQEY